MATTHRPAGLSKQPSSGSSSKTHTPAHDPLCTTTPHAATQKSRSQQTCKKERGHVAVRPPQVHTAKPR
jgi:hypothetical protein